MKTEAKVAWPKDHDFTQKCFEAISVGGDISHEDMLLAVNDPDHMKVFGVDIHQKLVKSTHVIFQYGIYLRRRDGRVAVFNRAMKEQDAERMNKGRSIFISQSIPTAPYFALPRILQRLICVSKDQRMGEFIPRGIAINPMGPIPNSIDPRNPTVKPTYLFVLYENVFPDGLILHGRFHESPDKFIGWVDPKDFGDQFSSSGKIDQMISEMLVNGELEIKDEGEGNFKYSPNSTLFAQRPSDSDGNELEGNYELAHYQQAYNVFISHAAEDSFAAYALYRLLIDESSRRIYPTIDVTHLNDGDELSKIRDEFIEGADCIIVVITKELLEKSAKSKSNKNNLKDWIEQEVKWAKTKGKEVLGFKLGAVGEPEYLKDISIREKSRNADWLKEVKGLIENIRERFNS